MASLQRSMSERTRQAKINSLVARLAFVIAKKKQNPDFAKYQKARARFSELKKKIILRHRGEAIAAARKLMAQQTSDAPKKS